MYQRLPLSETRVACLSVSGSKHLAPGDTWRVYRPSTRCFLPLFVFLSFCIFVFVFVSLCLCQESRATQWQHLAPRNIWTVHRPSTLFFVLQDGVSPCFFQPEFPGEGKFPCHWRKVSHFSLGGGRRGNCLDFVQNTLGG